ncbi:MAG: D-alanine--D-alanine ligase [Elusimicrobiota bacterium]|jgi:D-alanine-D-alanine ligase|nr:D-alanine--D-alanine ligase [Elusimicrobiota bacterium]
MPKLKIALLYGGKSTEHEVSVHSAKTVAQILERKYDILKIFINKEGLWFLQDKLGSKQKEDAAVSPVVNSKYNLLAADGRNFKADVFFPILHGAMGEDGTMQGMFEILNSAYVGCGVLTSALGMDKELCKLLASFYGVPIVPYIKLDSYSKYKDEELEAAVKKLGYPLFVKPLRLGSSVGVSKVLIPKQLKGALSKAFDYENSVLIEKGIVPAREIFCAVVGSGDNIHTSLCGELMAVNGEFFDYKAKYEDPRGCDMKIPADISHETQDKMRIAAHDIFKVLRGDGFARVDFLLNRDGDFYFSEINTIPGLSDTSLFPNLWGASKKVYADILDILIHLALKRKQIKEGFSLER